jgi:hypothetical protein
MFVFSLFPLSSISSHSLGGLASKLVADEVVGGYSSQSIGKAGRADRPVYHYLGITIPERLVPLAGPLLLGVRRSVHGSTQPTEGFGEKVWRHRAGRATNGEPRRAKDGARRSLGRD